MINAKWKLQFPYIFQEKIIRDLSSTEHKEGFCTTQEEERAKLSDAKRDIDRIDIYCYMLDAKLSVDAIDSQSPIVCEIRAQYAMPLSLQCFESKCIKWKGQHLKLESSFNYDDQSMEQSFFGLIVKKTILCSEEKRCFLEHKCLKMRREHSLPST